jgi:hypothetical protein
LIADWARRNKAEAGETTDLAEDADGPARAERGNARFADRSRLAGVCRPTGDQERRETTHLAEDADGPARAERKRAAVY